MKSHSLTKTNFIQAGFYWRIPIPSQFQLQGESIIQIWPILPILFRCRGLLFYLITHMDTYTLGRNPLDEGSTHRRDLYIHNTQPSQETHINSPGGTRTRNPSKRAATGLCYRPFGHWDLCKFYVPVLKNVLQVIHTLFTHLLRSTEKNRLRFVIYCFTCTVWLKNIVMTVGLLRIFSIFTIDQNNMLPDQKQLIKFIAKESLVCLIVCLLRRSMYSLSDCSIFLLITA
jgi:hypothetical protein